MGSTGDSQRTFFSGPGGDFGCSNSGAGRTKSFRKFYKTEQRSGFSVLVFSYEICAAPTDRINTDLQYVICNSGVPSSSASPRFEILREPKHCCNRACRRPIFLRSDPLVLLLHEINHRT
ncbi:hypothetical protein MRB53_007195 [Persea americana]|uniref:Uncharacterized protein n=1 Tax=Persea americana TaxID=3435 RepID=A0ACC2MI61_PERAE|nr:hypothetical protein MRB53_007195 [Persea americana]